MTLSSDAATDEATSAAIDATTAPVKPLPADAQHAALARLVGRWAGSARTWFDPTTPPVDSQWTLRGEALLGGRFVRLDYQGSEVMGTPHAGVMTLGYEQSEHQYNIHWIDSFHSGTGMMLSVSRHGELDVVGSYAAGPERWGWRTTLQQPHERELVIVMYNITPGGEETRALEIQLRRVD